jgi:uncharacterized protein YggL (DUF469 family)
MKKQTFTLIGLSIALSSLMTLQSCSDSSKTESESETKPKQEEGFKFNNALDKNERVKAYFTNFDHFIDEYVTLIEELAANQKAMEGEEPSAMDALSTLTTTAGALSKMEPYLTKMEELEKEGAVIQEELSPEELQLFMASYTKLLLRFQEASAKINQ